MLTSPESHRPQQLMIVMYCQQRRPLSSLLYGSNSYLVTWPEANVIVEIKIKKKNKLTVPIDCFEIVRSSMTISRSSGQIRT